MARKKKVSTKDRRSVDQDTAVEKAFVAGTLPEEDRRADSAAPASDEAPPAVPPVNPNDVISAVRERADGVRVTTLGHILE